MSDRWLEVGTIVSPQGLRGELRVYPNSDFPERFLKPGIRWLQHPQTAEVKEVELVKGRYISGKDLYVIKLAGVDDRNQADIALMKISQIKVILFVCVTILAI